MKESLVLRINSLFLALNSKINTQLNLLIHHPLLQALEASWRGLWQISQQHEGVKTIKIKILCLSLKELEEDFEKSTHFDDTFLFSNIYHQEFSHPGGEPLGLLLGDYYFSSSSSHLKTLATLSKISKIAFAPFVTSITPGFLQLRKFEELHKINMSALLKFNKNTLHQNLKKQEESCFLYFLLPRVILRNIYPKKTNSLFDEKNTLKENYLWGNAIYSLANIIIDKFEKTKWFLDSEPNEIKMDNENYFQVAKENHYKKHLTEIMLDPDKELNLINQGFSFLNEKEDKSTLYFKNLPSYYQEKPFFLQDVLCVCRLAHYIKIIMREKIGTFLTPAECENYLQNWLHHYTAHTKELGNETILKYPLKKAKISVYPAPGNIKKYFFNIYLTLHAKDNFIEPDFKLTSEIHK